MASLNILINSRHASGSKVDSPVRFKHLARLFCLSEGLLVGAAAASAASIYWHFAYGLQPEAFLNVGTAAVLATGVVGISVLRGSYERALSPGPGFLWSGLMTVLRVFGLLIAALFLAKATDDYSRMAFIVQLAAVIFFMLIARGLFQRAVRAYLVEGLIERERVMILGDLANDGGVQDHLDRKGFHVVSRLQFVQPGNTQKEQEFMRQIVEVCRTSRIDHVMLRASAELGAIAENVILSLGETPVTVQLLPQAGGALWSAKGEGVTGQPALIVRNQPLSTVELFLKRAFDFFLSFATFIALAPIFVAIAIAIRLDSKGPVLFRQTRHGYDNQPIRVYKFRSMRVMEDGAAFRQATRNDPRITRVGAFLRRTNLDELPQILNVLFGEMSIVGPRPHPIALNETFAKEIKLFHRRHNIRPGITGWAQINGHRGETDTLRKMSDRIEHDLWYVDNWSFVLDLKIILMTVFSPMAYKNAG